MKKAPRTLIIAIVAFIIVLVVLWIGNLILSKVVEKELQKNKNLFGYAFDFETVDVNVFNRNIAISGISAHDSIQTNKISAERIELKRLHLLAALFNKTFTFGKVLICNPDIRLLSAKTDSTAKSTNQKQQGNMPEINIDQIEIKNARLLVYDSINSVTDTVLNTGFNVIINNISNSNNNIKYKIKAWHFESVLAKFENTNYLLPNRLYKLQAQNFWFDTDLLEAQLDSVSFKSEYGKYEIADITGHETDWFDILATKIVLKNIQLDAMIRDTAFIVSHIEIPEIKMEVFRDKRPPFPDKPDTKLPTELIDGLPFGFQIDSVILKNTNITYQERRENVEEPGTVSFNNLEAKLTNIGNRPSLIKGKTIIETTTNVMNDALLSISFYFPNKKYPIKYSTSGHLNAMPMKPFTSMFRSSANTDLSSGNIMEMDFDFEYDEINSHGNLRFTYSDLHISVFNPESGEAKKINSFLINTFVLRDQNPDKNGDLKQGEIEFERDKKKSIFNYWWKSLMSGIKDVVTP
ncbi:hypothetical protein MASR2M47_31960 [Draconibacterium sp.]|jgi:hypothetical protein